MWLTKELANLKKSGLYNNILTIDSPIGGEIVIDSKRLLNFCSNNYLGLANNTRLKKAAIAAGEIQKKYLHSTTLVHAQDSTGLTYSYILTTQKDIEITGKFLSNLFRSDCFVRRR